MEKLNYKEEEIESGDFIIQYIKNQIYVKNRNFTALCQGKVGSGKSFSMIRLGEILDENFNVDNVFFKLKELMIAVEKDIYPAGSVLILDEAGIDISNRKSYMDKFNMAMSFLMQTWRYKNLIFLITVPESKFIDAGIRRLFDVHIETERVNKSRKTVTTKWKFTKINYQTGKTYFYRMRQGNKLLNIEISKPNEELINEYQIKKENFTKQLYKEIIGDLEIHKKIPYTEYYDDDGIKHRDWSKPQI